jgi:hypothetical protein
VVEAAGLSRGEDAGLPEEVRTVLASVRRPGDDEQDRREQQPQHVEQE